MTSDYDNFKSWFADVLVKLFPDRNNGFAILMIAFPLLERYIRQKVGLTPKQDLSDDSIDELLKLYPELKSRQVARQFWQVYRNGLLHEVTLSRTNRKGSTMPVGWISHDRQIISIEPDGSFWIHPVIFAERVIEAINADFTTFQGHSSTTSALPIVEEVHDPNFGSGECKIILGTSTYP